ncbi:MAG: (Fe-S)-binding protein [Promethearchaeota archaeon]
MSDQAEVNQEFAKLRDIANLCYRCKKCAVVCPVAPGGEFSPRKFLFEVNLEAPIRQELGVGDVFNTEENVWTCLTCGKCNLVCPQGINITEVVREVRREIFASNRNDPRFLATTTHLNIFPTAFDLMLRNERPPDKRKLLEKHAAEKGWVPLKMKSEGELAFYTGSVNLLEGALFELEIPQTKTAYSAIRLLNMAGIVPVVPNDYISGHDAYWSGDEDTFLAFLRRNVKIWRESGVKTLLVADAEDYRTIAIDYPKYLGPNDFPFEVIWLPDYIQEHGIFEKVRNRKVAFPRRVTIHDPCRIGRMSGGGHYESIRQILGQIPHLELVEMPHNRDDARCCGVSAFRNCNDYSRNLTRRRIREAMKVDAEFVVTTCPKCVSHLTCVSQNEFTKIELEVGVEVPRTMELFAFLGTVYDYTGTHEVF